MNTFPDGTQSEVLIGTDGSRVTTLPEDMVITGVEGPDPRWGMQAPLAQSLTTTTPGGLMATLTSERMVTLANPDDPLSLATQTDMVGLNGHTYTSTYTGATQSFTNTTPQGRQNTTQIDTLGRIIEEQVPGIDAVQYTYDARGRLATITQGTGSNTRAMNFSYNNDGYLDTVTDPVGRTISFAYDAAGRVTTQTLPDNRVISYTYDANGNLASLTPPGRPAHSFAYTSVNLESEYTPPDVNPGNDQTQYTYNLDRQLTRITRPDGTTVDFTYDSAGRLGTLSLPGGQISYTYNPTTGNLTTITAPDGGTLSYTYDGSLPTSKTWSGTINGSLSYSYDNNFRITSQSVNGGQTVAFGYDSDGLLIQAGDLTLNHDLQNGLITGTSLGNVTTTQGYNGFGELSSYQARFNTTELLSVQYTQDKLGRITEKVETIDGQTDTYNYVYDLAGRLIEVKKNGNTIATYTYDSNGNRLSYTNLSGTVNGSYDAQDRLTQYNTMTYTYTTNGELLSKTTGSQLTTYQYDALGNLKFVTLPDGTQ
ncbi:MAG: hypothetical protein L0Y56_12335, partial [Nitrospira sp.]|nr:hypothetical protein [Nitrospira sp.]